MSAASAPARRAHRSQKPAGDCTVCGGRAAHRTAGCRRAIAAQAA